MSVFSRLLAIVLITLLAVAPVQAAENDDAGNPLATLPLRPIGPAITSGRISDFAFYPGGDHEFLAGISSGNLFRTTNGGITWEAIFENEGSYAIGVVELDPNDTKTIWVGTGENNSQRSVAAGDGVYKSTDGGKSWTWGSRIRVISARSGSTRKIPTKCWSLPRGHCGAMAAIVVSTEQWMAVIPGSGF